LAVEQSVFNAISESYLNDNITLLELRFNPFLRNRSGFYDVDMVISHACIGLIRAMSIYPVKAGIIISTDRSFDTKLSNILAKKAIKYKGLGVIGFDMSGGNISGFDIKAFKSAFDIVREANLGITIHTAEVSDISLEETEYIIKNFHPNRIGHGIKIVNNQNLMKLVCSENIHLEICPTSNVITKCVNGYEDFNGILRTLEKNDINYSINTDGCVFLNTSVTNEYNKLIEIGFIKKEEKIKELEQASIKASFIK
jgi:adenosine deaminase